MPSPEEMKKLAEQMPQGGLPPNMPGTMPGMPKLPPNMPGMPGFPGLGGKFPGLPGGLPPGLGKKK
jgi:signal recognition particle subunit SRP54